MELEEIEKEVKEILSAKRYEHSLAVEKQAAHLAKIYGQDITRAKLAGITHDIAKEMSKEELLKYAGENNIPIEEIEKKVPKVLHGKIGAAICKNKYGFDEQLQKAICYHTTGSPDMDMLAKIIYIADITEETRDFPQIEQLRSLTETDINKAIIFCLEREIKSKIEEGKLLHPLGIITRNQLLIEEKKNSVKS